LSYHIHTPSFFPFPFPLLPFLSFCFSFSHFRSQWGAMTLLQMAQNVNISIDKTHGHVALIVMRPFLNFFFLLLLVDLVLVQYNTERQIKSTRKIFLDPAALSCPFCFSFKWARACFWDCGLRNFGDLSQQNDRADPNWEHLALVAKCFRRHPSVRVFFFLKRCSCEKNSSSQHMCQVSYICFKVRSMHVEAVHE
jgi:hypothetical protein